MKTGTIILWQAYQILTMTAQAILNILVIIGSILALYMLLGGVIEMRKDMKFRAKKRRAEGMFEQRACPA